MKRLLAVLLALVAGCASIGGFEKADPAETVHLLLTAVNVEDEDGTVRRATGWCSTVAIKPGVALTARHCVDDTATASIDGLPVTNIKFVADDPILDTAVLTVPGLACPCAEIGVNPTPGDEARIIGFPGRYKGELRDRSLVIEAIDGFIVTGPAAEGGDSGGGLFVKQDGHWKLVGTTSFMVAFFGMYPVASGFVPIDAIKSGLLQR